MRLVTFDSGEDGAHVGVLLDDQVLDLTVWLGTKQAMPTFDMLDLIEMGDAGLRLVRHAVESAPEDLDIEGAILPLAGLHLLAPIPRPRKNVFCLGRNYAEHAAESTRAWGEDAPPPPPQYPAIFTKAPTSVIGPYDDIPYDPNVTRELDWEVELAVVLGKQGKNIRRDEAFDYIFGYMVLNDISAREVQKRHGGQFFKGKSLDGTCPIGPWIVTADELGDPGDLQLWTRVNGEVKQHDTTRSMLLDVAGTIESLSLGMTLEPGDIIATGTPAGVGFARTPPEYLFPGDVVECEVERIGVIRNRVANPS
ncbi:MAG: fumarylacetoacetate hydrolase family protein [Chloroflexota bacterium]|nr:fumarylacetoacetate hydrolase family protein [Chloroflexota bacterium]MDQ5865917.1 fumarylacetoacetate hydrolase family protein [Chloroflexota bacterium]